MKCVIIDDEPLAVDIIETYVNQIGGIEIVAKCNSPLEAITILNKHQVDVVFLDIEMPNLTGLDLVRTIENMPQFIFTTAYPQHAIEGFDLNATDYLVKPIPFHRFLKTVARAKEKHALEKTISGPTSSMVQQEAVREIDFIFVKSEYENIKINIQNITYIEALKDYIKIYQKDDSKALLTLSNFKSILEKLSGNFMRVHRSYIINIDAIQALQKTRFIIGDKRIPIGETYKEDVLKRLKV
ncbi:LytR/AlgR family response regulator transcription factor [Psychroflexus sp. MES1-P1E]|jgi:two-component system LytT family response regulator|uniref:LytR/AlgR family response regulator transcription factor n=1 Tax=Psychroflexus sp. MES1-P1E TaxID=2058320 RepID=UPI000C7D9233|nr:response regulator transcription factor [Psychroflexus sp. MES1-P1E]PKG43767.1 DNA-binding response regulator [Psychroflexus sp. MES1-P1E]